MPSSTKSTIRVVSVKPAQNTPTLTLRVQSPEAPGAQQIMIAHQTIPFLRGFALRRGVEYSALND